MPLLTHISDYGLRLLKEGHRWVFQAKAPRGGTRPTAAGRRPVLAPDGYKRRGRQRRIERTSHSEAEVRAWADVSDVETDGIGTGETVETVNGCLSSHQHPAEARVLMKAVATVNTLAGPGFGAQGSAANP